MRKMTTEKFLPYGHQSIDQSDILAVEEALRSDVITRGFSVRTFEEAIASYTGAKYAIAFSNGTTALFAAYQALHASDQDVLYTTPNTFIATASAAKRCGTQIRYVDIDRSGNGNFLEKIEEMNAPRSRGRVFISPVHFAGVAIDMEPLVSGLKNENVHIIEDASHALGSVYPDGDPVGSCRYSDMTILSFHPVKNITTGEGGMVTTNSQKLYERLLLLRNSGIQRKGLTYNSAPEPFYYEVHELSCNYHMTDFQAALGISQLKKIERFREKKRQILSWYRKKLSSIPGVELPNSSVDDRTLYHLFVVRIGFQELDIPRQEFMRQLEEMGIGSQVHYVPLYCHPALGARQKDYVTAFPEMERYFQTALSLPFFVDMEEVDVNRVAVALRKIIFMQK